jgi:hypothetical protein
MLKKGYVRKDGMIFWSYNKTSKNGEVWISKERFDERLIKQKDSQRKYNKTDKSKKRSKKYYDSHIQERRSQSSYYAKRNRESIRIKERERNRRNPEVSLAKIARRRAIKAERLHPDHDGKIEIVLRESGRRLKNCLGFNWDLDHILPLTRNGWHHHCNLQLLPKSLNCKKRNNKDYPLPDCYKKHID